MRASHVVAVDPATLVDAEPNGWVSLGEVDGVAYCHVGRTAPVVRMLWSGAGDMMDPATYTPLADGEDAPADAIVAVRGGRVDLPWGDAFDLVFDPSPAPFAWEDFAAAHPTLAGQLRPHQWAGE
jgi:hypothetical protein